jgi:hypothetical protein
VDVKKCVVKVIWREETASWHAESDDIPGLAPGADTFDELVERIRKIAPALLKQNCDYTGPAELLYAVARIDCILVPP